MILRVIRGRAGPAELEALRGGLASRLRPGEGAPDGPTRVHLGRRSKSGQTELLIVSFWSSAEAAGDSDMPEVDPLAVAHEHLRDPSTAHFEVDETILRHSDAQPVAVRIATGRFSKPGADIEMQDLLRQRVPLVADDMCEAYVGRRIVGRAVEVTFVSAWRRVPEDRRLEDVFWPDIALRYDDFVVEVYEALPLR